MFTLKEPGCMPMRYANGLGISGETVVIFLLIFLPGLVPGSS